MAKKITIRCEHCGEILSFNKELSVQHCSKCGKPIVLCDLCPNFGKDIDCSPCPLLILKKLELKEFTYNMTLTEFANYLNGLSIDELKKGVSFKDKYPLDDNIYSTLLIKYMKDLGGIICYEEENDEGSAYFFKTNLKNRRQISQRLLDDMIYNNVGEKWKEIIIVKQPK